MKNKVVFLRLLFVFIVLFTLVGGIMVYKINQDIAKGYELKESIVKLSSINQEIDFLLETVLLRSDYDKTMSLVGKFDEELLVILSRDYVKKFGEFSFNLSQTNNIKNEFVTKKGLIDKFNSTTISTKIIQNNILTENFTKSRYFKIIAPRLLLFKYDFNINLNQIDSIIDSSLIKSRLGMEDLKFLTSSKELLGNYTQIKEILDSIKSLRIEEYIQSLLHNNQIYLDSVNSKLKRVSSIFFVLMILCLFITYMVYVKFTTIFRYISHLTQALDSIFSSVLIIDNKKKIKYVNKIFEETTGHKLEQIEGKTTDILASHPYLNESYSDTLKAVEQDGSWRCDEFVSVSKDEELVYEQVLFTPLFDDTGSVEGYISSKFDRTKEIFAAKSLQKKDAELKDKALFDELTGLGSYLALIQRLNEHPSGKIIYININNFMDLRFFYKTSTIDLIISSFAKTLQLCIDTYDLKATAYRVQFDEFCVWYDGDNEKQDIGYIRDYFRSNDIYVTIDDKKEFIPNIKTTIGVSLDSDTVQTSRLTQALLAHHEAKSKGEGILYYTENSHIEEQYYQNQIMSRIIEYALQNDTVIVECQGVYDISNGVSNPKVRYYEVLVRLVDEAGRIRYPGEFLDIAKKISLYTDITKKVIAHTFRLIERFPDEKFSMNLANSDIQNPKIQELIEQKLKNCSYPSHVYFEILESEGVDDYKSVNSFISKIREYNSKIAIDDFGSGYSNYYRILELDIDTIKIDGSIIKKLPFDKNARHLMQTIIDFANRQKYNVVAEFVSSEEILNEVSKFGIKYVQGFLLGKPISPEKIEQMGG